jgi:transcriptional regulator with XRE-family HTH domain
MASQKKEQVPYKQLGDALLRMIGNKTQSWVAGLLGVTQEAVSLWCSGKKQPSLFYLIELAYQFNEEPGVLAQLAGYDPQMARQLYAQRFVSFFDLEYLKSQEKYIYQARIGGNPQLAQEMAEAFSALINRKGNQIAHAKFFPEIEKIQARIWVEQAIAFRETCQANQVDQALKFANGIKTIGQKYGDYEIIALGNACATDTHYISKRWRNAIYEASEGKKLYDGGQEKDFDNILLMLRTEIMSHALLSQVDEFKRAATKAIKRVQHRQFIHTEVVCTLLEGVSTGQGILRLKDAPETLDKARDFLSQTQKEHTQKPTFRYIQIARSGLQSALHLGMDTGPYVKVAEEALRLAQGHKYLRYVDQLNTLLRKVG